MGNGAAAPFGRYGAPSMPSVVGYLKRAAMLHPRPRHSPPPEDLELDDVATHSWIRSPPAPHLPVDDEEPAMREEDEREEDALLRPHTTPDSRRLLFKLGSSFFLFGLINNVLYVVILSAALDLVPPSTPKGIIAFCNIFPALVAKVGWPYVLKGRIRYTRRIIGNTILSVLGMLVVAMFDSLYMRLLGICLASFSSGLGELTYLQLSTTYHPPSVAGDSVGYFAAGTGAAGLVGASWWWMLRNLGVQIGVGVSSILPLVIPLAYYTILPQPAAFADLHLPPAYEDDTIGPVISPYTPIPSSDDPDLDEQGTEVKRSVALTAKDKWALVKPLLMVYMLPLFIVYTLEYTINQGVAPTLVYPVPSPEKNWLLSHIIHSVRDYYPLWQLVYQTTVFFSRSAITLGFPPLPRRLLPLPAAVQAVILTILVIDSAVGIFSDESEGLSISLVFLLIALEGICGGLAYVNVFYRVNQENTTSADGDPERSKQEREFKIGSIGFADSMGILLASLIAVPTEVQLCNIQAARGKMICKSL
ncbi:battenin CLN3 protein [Steccherinum ochraceum]|uniref:Protein BTN n=1 Tax=Steccherinum ochraceum TaxID=92696 RepID=A0A4R0R2G9_9APHY|nr:battenin CLN3 protein [Steccherinum ochraceum]